MIATRFLGRHKLSLPVQEGTTDVEQALLHLRALLYASERGVDGEEFWERLEQIPVKAVMGCFCEIEHALLERTWYEPRGTPRRSLSRAFGLKLLDVARRFLDGEEEAAHYHFAYDRDRAPDLAFQIIELHGDRTDIARLRRLANGSRHARRALDALRKLDAA